MVPTLLPPALVQQISLTQMPSPSILVVELQLQAAASTSLAAPLLRDVVLTVAPVISHALATSRRLLLAGLPATSRGTTPLALCSPLPLPIISPLLARST